MAACKTRNPSRRERKKADTRQRVLNAATELFLGKGFDQTSVEEITGAAKIAKGTFFNYFDAKEDVLYALLERRAIALGEEVRKSSVFPASPVARVKRMLRLVAADPLTKQLLNQLAVSGRIPVRHTSDRPLLREVIDQVRQGQAIGEIRAELDPVIVSGMIIALFFHQIAMWQHGHRPDALSESIDMAVDSLLEGIAGPEWRRSS
jgi:TetR/AcrR family transcriptional regulator, cholesterol catabolism regulator